MGPTPWLACAVAAAVTLPLVYLVVRAGAGGGAGFVRAVVSDLTARLLGRTLLLTLAVGGASLALALPVAWLVVRTDLPGRRTWAVLAALPLVFPSYVAAFTWVAFFGVGGYLDRWALALGAPWLDLSWLAEGFPGALAVLTLFSYPYIYLLLVAALRDVDPALEESARSLGCGRWRTFLRVTVPQVRPALSAGTLLVVLYTLSDFGAVSIVRYNTFTLAIYNAYRGLFDRSVAASLAIVLVLLTVGFIALEAFLSRGQRPGRVRAARRSRPVPLGPWRAPATALLTLVVGSGLALPVAVVISWVVRAVALGNPLGRVGGALLASVQVSLLAAVAAVVLSLPAALWSVRQPGTLSHLVERVTHAGYALPGLVVALALVFFATRTLMPLYQTTTLLVAAYVIRFLPEALAATRSSLASLSPVFEEAARSLGRTRGQVTRQLVLPLIRPGLLAGGGLVFLTAMKELPATLILRPTGMETLATRVWSGASEAIWSLAAVPSLLLLLASAPPMYLLVIRPALADRRGGAG